MGGLGGYAGNMADLSFLLSPSFACILFRFDTLVHLILVFRVDGKIKSPKQVFVFSVAHSCSSRYSYRGFSAGLTWQR